jgi:hypothetical protein
VRALAGAVPSRLVWLLVGSGASVALLVWSASVEVALLAGIAVVIVTPIAFRIRKRQLDVFEPIVVFAVAYGVMFVLRPSFMLLADDVADHRATAPYDLSDTFAEMLLVALVGAVAFVAGYLAPAASRLPERWRPPALDLDLRKTIIALGVVVIVGVVSFVAFLAAAGGLAAVDLFFSGRSLELLHIFREVPAYFTYGSTVLVPAALLLTILGVRRRSWPLLVASAAVLAVVILKNGAVGSRIQLLPLVGGGFVYYFIARDTRPRARVLLAVAALALVLSSVLLIFRDANSRAGRTPLEALADVASNPAVVIRPLTQGHDAAMAPFLAAALKFIPEEVPHMYGGATVGDLLARAVPRQLWPEKPLPPRERLIGVMWPAEWANGVLNPEFSVLLAFYLDFGILGVAGGMALYGVAWRASYEYFRRFASNFTTQVVFALSLPLLVVAVRDSPVDTLVRVVLIVGPVLAVFLFARRQPSTGGMRSDQAPPAAAQLPSA